jgi:hypothetical protein
MRPEDTAPPQRELFRQHRGTKVRRPINGRNFRDRIRCAHDLFRVTPVS